MNKGFRIEKRRIGKAVVYMVLILLALYAIRQKRPMLFGFIFKSLLKPKNYDELINRFIAIFDLVDYLNKN